MGLTNLLPHIPDCLPEASSLNESSTRWMRRGQVTDALINKSFHPDLNVEWIDPEVTTQGYIWQADCVLCRYHERELFVISRVMEKDTVELTWEADLHPERRKRLYEQRL